MRLKANEAELKELENYKAKVTSELENVCKEVLVCHTLPISRSVIHSPVIF